MLEGEDNSIENSRALLTENDRKCICTEEDSAKKYQAVSRVRNRVQNELATDLKLLKSHHSELFTEAMEVLQDV